MLRVNKKVKTKNYYVKSDIILQIIYTSEDTCDRITLQNSGGIIMKKIFVSVLTVLMCVLMLSACGGGKTLNDTPLDVALSQVNDAVFDGGESMRIIDSVDKLELYYSIDPQDVVEFAAEVSKNSATEIDEVILIKAVDDAAAKRIA